jgi:hypothetical protein
MGVSEIGCGAHPPANPGLRMEPCRGRSSKSEESPVRGDVGYYPPPHQNVWSACCALSDGILHLRVSARTLTQRHLPGGCCGGAYCQILEVGGVVVAP